MSYSGRRFMRDFSNSLTLVSVFSLTAHEDRVEIQSAETYRRQVQAIWVRRKMRRVDVVAALEFIEAFHISDPPPYEVLLNLLDGKDRRRAERILLKIAASRLLHDDRIPIPDPEIPF